MTLDQAIKEQARRYARATLPSAGWTVEKCGECKGSGLNQYYGQLICRECEGEGVVWIAPKDND